MNISELIKAGENKRLELKKELPSNEAVAKTVVAFSNTSGGMLIIGVADDLEIVGVDEDKIFQMEEKISSVISDLCTPAILPEIYTLNMDGKLLLVVEIFRGSLLPYYLKNKGKNKGTFFRVGSTNRIADELMIMDLERQRRKLSFDEEENFDYDISDLNLDSIFHEFDKIGRPVDDQKLKNLKLIKSHHDKDYPVNALLIALGLFDNVLVKCARFKGVDMDEFIDRKEYSGNLFEILEGIISFLKNHLRLQSEITGLQRKDEYEIPLVAIRETLLNAIVHRDYTRNRDIKVAVYDDIVEITSPGPLPNGITVQDISNGRSELRNKVLANLFKELGYIESWGSGIARVKKICKEKNIHFIIEEAGDFVRVVFVRPQEKARKSPQEPARKSPQGSARKEEIEEKLIIDFILKNGQIKRSRVMEILECGETKAKRILKRMTDVHLEKITKGKYTYYILKNTK